MIIKGSELLGLEVVNKNNIQVGYSVKDIIFSNKGYYIAALLLKNEGVKKESLKKARVLSFNKIIGIDKSIITSNEKSIISLENREDLYFLAENPIKLIGYEIYSNEHDLVGIVKDTIINKATGRIMGLVLSEGILTDIYNGYSILPLGSSYEKINNNKIIVNDGNMDKIFNYGGGLKNILSIDLDN